MIPFGVTYYPDQWPEKTWDNTFRQIKEAGLNIIRFNEMAWDQIEPEPGKYSFAALDHALDLCQKHEIKVLLGIPTSQVPPWFYRLYPNSRPVTQDGALYPEFGPRPNVCKDNTAYRKHAEKLTKEIVSRYKNHPALLYWQVDNEPVYPPLDHTTSNDYCHCEETRQAFIAWAKKKYGTLDKINEVWGNKFWTNTLSSFDDIRTPKAGIWEAVSPHIFLDWFRFKTDSIKNWIGHLANIVRDIDPNHKVGTNGFVGICTRVPDHSIVAGDLDWYGLDVYPKGGKMSPEALAFTLDLWRSFTRGKKAEFHVTEMQGGQNVRWGCPDYVEGPEIKGWTTAAFEHGAQALLYHAWRPPLFGAETGGFGILKTDGSSTKRLETIKALAKQTPNSQLRTPNSSRTAIAYLRTAEVQTYQEQGPARGISGQWEAVRSEIGLMYGLFSVNGAYSLVYKKGQLIDFIFEQDLEIGNFDYKTLLLPNPYTLSLSQYKNLKSFVENGGTLITDARFGQKTENAHLYLKPLIEDLLGVTYDHGEVIKEGFLDIIKGYTKKPQLITKKVGKGKVVYANFSLFLAINQGSKKWLTAVKKYL
ncbi:MAG: alpha-amylase family protein [bacterium]